MKARTNDLADQIDTFIKCVDRYLKRRQDVQPWIAGRQDPHIPRSPQEAKSFNRIHARDEQEMILKASVMRMGKPLAARLESQCIDTDLFKLLHFIYEGGGPDGAYEIWPDIKATLRKKAIQLRTRPKKTKAKKDLTDDQRKKAAQVYLDDMVKRAYQEYGTVRKVIEALEGKATKHQIEKSIKRQGGTAALG